MSKVGRHAVRSVAVLAAGLALVGCGRTAAPGAEPERPVVAGVQPPTACRAADEVAAPDAPVGDVVDAITRFGHDLSQAAAAPGENLVLSPLSVSTAFAMARAGAAGETAAEIDDVLHFPPAGLHDAMGELDRRLTGDKVLRTANGLFVQQDFPLLDSFCTELAQSYGASPFTVDFAAPAAKKTIDAWVSDRTDGQIDELFAQLPPTTDLVVANAVSLDAQWAVPFGRAPIIPAPFTTADGSIVTADRMQVAAELRTALVAGNRFVDVPYADSGLAMRLILPAPDVMPIDALDPTIMAAANTALAAADSSTIVELRMPRWTTTSELELKELLNRLGMIAPFGPADFSAMTTRGVFIEQAIHRATITVNEHGTTAAAVTGLSFNESGPPTPEITVQLDRPFAYAIVDVATGTPVFLGQVNDPTSP